MKELKPLKTRIMVLPKKNPYVKSKTDTGIILPNQAFSSDSGKIEDLEEVIQYGEVLEVGKNVKEVKVGDGVFFSKFSVTPVPFYDNGFLIIDELNIVAYAR